MSDFDGIVTVRYRSNCTPNFSTGVGKIDHTFSGKDLQLWCIDAQVNSWNFTPGTTSYNLVYGLVHEVSHNLGVGHAYIPEAGVLNDSTAFPVTTTRTT